MTFTGFATIHLVRDMNLNTIRLEGKLETEEFFRLADEQGILVMLGWCCCDHWEHWKDWTADDLAIASASLRAQMLRLRQHASLLVWLNGSDNPPPANVERAYLAIESETHWPNPVLSSATGTPTTVTGESGVKMTGPYDYVEPSYWYVDQHNGGGFGFNTETSPGPALPSLASRQKFLPDADAWPPTPTWSSPLRRRGIRQPQSARRSHGSRIRQAESAADYERMAQTMAYDSERAMFEAYGKNKYFATGVMQWMLNNAWPSMIWHLYDYYLDAGGGYYGTKKACEPLHIQYSYDDRSIVIVNSTYAPVEGLQASVQVHGLQWNELYSAKASSERHGRQQRSACSPFPRRLYSGPERIFFIDLTLSDAAGTRLSRNFYWVPGTLTTFDWNKTDYTRTPAARHEDLTALTRLPQAQVEAHAEIEGHTICLRLKNASSALAFQIRAAARTPSGGLIAPVFWSDNWIELTPGESTELTAKLPDGISGEAPVIQVEGWNVAPVTITPSPAPAR